MKFENINGMEFARYIAANILTDSSLTGAKYYAKEDELTSKIAFCLEQAKLTEFSEQELVNNNLDKHHMEDIENYLEENNRTATEDEKAMILDKYKDFLEEASDWNYNLEEAVNLTLGNEEEE